MATLNQKEKEDLTFHTSAIDLLTNKKVRNLVEANKALPEGITPDVLTQKLNDSAVQRYLAELQVQKLEREQREMDEARLKYEALLSRNKASLAKANIEKQRATNEFRDWDALARIDTPNPSISPREQQGMQADEAENQRARIRATTPAQVPKANNNIMGPLPMNPAAPENTEQMDTSPPLEVPHQAINRRDRNGRLIQLVPVLTPLMPITLPEVEQTEEGGTYNRDLIDEDDTLATP
jgi:hypothetical protein